MTTDTTGTAAPVPRAAARQLPAIVDAVADLVKRHNASGQDLLRAFAHPDITDEQIIAMARSYGAGRRGLREALKQLKTSPRILSSWALQRKVDNIKL